MKRPAITKSLSSVLGWARAQSLWPMIFGTGCCSASWEDVDAGPCDLALGDASFLAMSPRQADCLLVMGPISWKQAPLLRRVYEQMPHPKGVVAVGSCAASGGPCGLYHLVHGIDRVVPVDLFVPGCPPSSEQLIDALDQLRGMLRRGKEGP